MNELLEEFKKGKLRLEYVKSDNQYMDSLEDALGEIYFASIHGNNETVKWVMDRFEHCYILCEYDRLCWSPDPGPKSMTIQEFLNTKHIDVTENEILNLFGSE